MTVDELIAQLQALPPETRALVAHFEGEPGCAATPIESLYVDHSIHVITGAVIETLFVVGEGRCNCKRCRAKRIAAGVT
jgi:hypothetical protein